VASGVGRKKKKDSYLGEVHEIRAFPSAASSVCWKELELSFLVVVPCHPLSDSVSYVLDMPTWTVSRPSYIRRQGAGDPGFHSTLEQSPLYDITAHHHGNISPRVTETGLWHHSIRQQGEERIGKD
jgi:hypothetical protein